nr:MAG TPA: hypothetical protein [Caudoviricetes sp.]
MFLTVIIIFSRIFFLIILKLIILRLIFLLSLIRFFFIYRKRRSYWGIYINSFTYNSISVYITRYSIAIFIKSVKFSMSIRIPFNNIYFNSLYTF